MLTHNLINLFNKETIGAALATIPTLKLILNYFNKPIEDVNELYKKAKISTWRVRLFMVKISTKKIPYLTNIDIILFSFLALFLISTSGVGSFYGIKLLQLPDGWTSLILKETDEWFLITTTTASEHAFNPSWYITEKTCQSGAVSQLINERKITSQLGKFICNSLTNKKTQIEIIKSIKESDKNKSILFLITAIITIGSFWFLISLILTTIYTLRLKKFITEEHRKSYHYLT